jgi:hypothetical protein
VEITVPPWSKNRVFRDHVESTDLETLIRMVPVSENIISCHHTEYFSLVRPARANRPRTAFCRPCLALGPPRLAPNARLEALHVLPELASPVDLPFNEPCGKVRSPRSSNLAHGSLPPISTVVRAANHQVTLRGG